ncbi:MAG: DUF2252 domain-containing protein [Proteobacteria bacterium]|nr:DUF2252 domain-containing protein [Pseudomonadota bacterium]
MAKKASREPTFLHADERRAAGKALREEVPRTAHAHWKAPKDRRDIVEILEASNHGRLDHLIPIRHGRMMESPFAFYRGTADIMAADLASTPVSGIRVQACGDAHLCNFGGFATPERRVIFDINDFDETLPGPWEWDIKRLAASLLVAGRQIGLAESESVKAARAAAGSYRERMSDYAEMRTLDVWYDAIDVDRFIKAMESEERREIIRKRLEKVEEKNVPEYLFPKLADHTGTTPRIKDDPPLIFHPTLEQAPGIETRFSESLAAYRDSLPEHVRTLFNRFEFCDFALKVVGVGSVGRLCGVVLLMADSDDPLFLQVKEAVPSVLEPYIGKSQHENHGQRVVVGQRLMQSASDLFLGWTHGLDGRSHYVRQLRDMKISPIVESFDANDLKVYGRMCAWALARAHARSGDPAMIAGYLGGSEVFDDAIADFAVDYADQAQRDYRTFVKAIRQGRLKAERID